MSQIGEFKIANNKIDRIEDFSISNEIRKLTMRGKPHPQGADQGGFRWHRCQRGEDEERKNERKNEREKPKGGDAGEMRAEKERKERMRKRKLKRKSGEKREKREPKKRKNRKRKKIVRRKGR